MAIRKKGDGWQVDASYKGRRAPRVTVYSEQEARKLESYFRAELEAGRTPTVPSSKEVDSLDAKRDVATLKGLLDYTIRNHWRGTKSEETQSRCARLMVEAIGEDTPTANVDKYVVDQARLTLEAEGNSTATINRKVVALRVMLKLAEELGAIDKAPKIKLGKTYSRRIRYYTDEEEESLLRYFADDHDLRDALIIGIDLGYRQAEIFGLQVRDYVPATGKLHLWETKANVDGGRANPVTPRVRKLVECRLRGRHPTDKLIKPITRKEISRRIHMWRDYVGLPKDDEACFHTTRHTCCSRLVMAGVPLPVVKEWMGHADIQQTMRYAHLAPNSLSLAHEALVKGAWKGVVSPVTSDTTEGDIAA